MKGSTPTAAMIAREIEHARRCLEVIERQMPWALSASFQPVRRGGDDLETRVSTSDTKDETFVAAIAGQPKWIREQTRYAAKLVSDAVTKLNTARALLDHTMGTGERFTSVGDPPLVTPGELREAETAKRRRQARGEDFGNA